MCLGIEGVQDWGPSWESPETGIFSTFGPTFFGILDFGLGAIESCTDFTRTRPAKGFGSEGSFWYFSKFMEWAQEILQH